jgi:glutamate synthase domain-containing protein 2
MVSRSIFPDFITVDGAEGGTGAAPLEFANSVGTPLNEGLAFIHDSLVGFGIRQHIRVIASGKVFTSFHLLTKIALGADMVNSARGMMLALGCIHALLCNTNRCPVGVATNDPNLANGLHIPDKSERVARFHSETIHALAEVLGAMGYDHTSQIRRIDINRRDTDGKVSTYEELFPSVAKESMLYHTTFEQLSAEIKQAIQTSTADSFKRVS